MSIERRELPAFPGYLVSSDGVVWTTKRKGGNDRARGLRGEPRPMRMNANPAGYLVVTFDVGGKRVTRTVHSLVLEAFVGPRPDGCEGCHFPDADKTNNRVENLRWDTHKENIRDKTRHRIGATLKVCRRCGETKAVEDFYADRRASDGRQTECKRCHIRVGIETRDPDRKRAVNRECMRRRRAR